MTYTPQDDEPSPMLRLDSFRLVLGIRKDHQPMIWWPDGMTTAEARSWLDTLYTVCRDYLEEVSQPPKPREKPSPHYRPVQSRPLPNRIED